eukprot:7429528-Heterocapsa_arctica.AAC.1
MSVARSRTRYQLCCCHARKVCQICCAGRSASAPSARGTSGRRCAQSRALQLSARRAEILPRP